MLAKWGLDLSKYTVVFKWEERAQNGSNTLIKGMRLAPLSGGAAFDVYADALERRLGPGELAALHIAPKDWSVQTVSVDAELPADTKAAASAPTPRLSVRETPRVTLPVLDHGQLLAEDAALHGIAKAARRIGVFQDIPGGLAVTGGVPSLGAWQTQADGSQVWAATIEAPGARGQRLHITDLALPPGGMILVQNARATADTLGPFTTLPDGGLWTPTCFADAVTLVCFLPAGAKTAGVTLRADRIIHVYADLTAVPYQEVKAGSCNLNLLGYPEWTAIGRGVGGIGSVTNRGYLWCTGSLIADALPGSQRPLFLTAAHCVGSQGSAESIEIYWLYDANASSVLAVPRTAGGADLLATANKTDGSDVTLLRLRNQPPAGLSFLGWTTALPRTLDDVIGIHHPFGEYKRISFGRAMGVLDAFHTVQWTGGTTEPGSSGSPLFTREGRIIGQLFGGYASCAWPLEPDYYGRLDASWPILRPWLSDVPLPWDVDGSGRVDAVDLQLAVRAALQEPVAYNADVDGSGKVDAVDVQLVIIALMNVIAP